MNMREGGSKLKKTKNSRATSSSFRSSSSDS